MAARSYYINQGLVEVLVRKRPARFPIHKDGTIGRLKL